MSMYVQQNLTQILNKDTFLCLVAFLKLHIRTLSLPRQYTPSLHKNDHHAVSRIWQKIAHNIKYLRRE